MPELKNLTREDVVSAGLDTLDEVGLDKFTMRLVANRLGVQLNTIYWHATSKPVLLDLMADEQLAGVTAGRFPREWRSRVTTLANRYRGALLGRRDGGRLAVARFQAGPNTVLLSEALHSAFAAGGFAPATVSHASWSVSYLALASVIEEQGEPSAWEASWDESSTSLRRDDVVGQAMRHSVTGNHRDRFDFGVDALLTGLSIGGADGPVS
jgi:TetR/AcrR family transcriptional regulator, tetracycline repressor protein